MEKVLRSGDTQKRFMAGATSPRLSQELAQSLNQFAEIFCDQRLDQEGTHRAVSSEEL
jgi:hypothetical protein